MLKVDGAFADKSITPVMAPGPAIKGTRIGLIAISSDSLNSSISVSVVLERPT